MLCLKLVVVLCAVFSAVYATTYVPLRRQQVVNEFINTQYAGDVTIGTQTFLLVFDTSSPYVIVPSQECMGGACRCITLVRYIGSSGNAEPITVTFFDTAEATGRPITQSLTIVNLTSPNQGIIVANTLDEEVCDLGASGVAGLAPPPAATDDDLATFIANFYALGYIKFIFSIHHARYADGEHYGGLVIGGSDLTFVASDFTVADLVEQTSWKFRLDEVLVGSVNVADNNTLGFIDTSKAVILGPEAQINQINTQIGCTPTQVDSETIVCAISCNAVGLPDVTFVINGTNFVVDAEHYVQRNGELCYSGFVPSGESYYMIGDIFIDQYYCEFNWEERAMRIATAVQIVP